MSVYTGPLDLNKMAPQARQGYRSWQHQRSKCSNKKDPDFKNYGAKGVRCQYSSREFVGWWLKNLSKKKWKSPTVGRIDHDGNYSFDNIEMQEKSENSRERIVRKGPPGLVLSRGVLLSDSRTGERLVIFNSRAAAARYLGIDAGNVSNLCNGKIKPGRREYLLKDLEL